MLLLICKVKVLEQFLFVALNFDWSLLLFRGLLLDSFWGFAALVLDLALVEVEVAVHAGMRASAASTL